MNINTCKRCLLVQYVVDFGGTLQPLNGLLIILKKHIYVWSTASGQIIAKEGCEFELEPLHIAFGNSHFEPIEKLNQNMPIILPSED
jgi:hypothetical protein